MSLREQLRCFQRYADAGFQEIDYVLQQQLIEQRYYAQIEEGMTIIHQFCVAHGIQEKAIVEMCKLDEEGKRKICEIAGRVKPAYLKTSTGKSFAGATLEDVKLMRALLPKEVRIKAAGGIRTYEQALAFLASGADVIGTSAGIQIVEEERQQKGTACYNDAIIHR